MIWYGTVVGGSECNVGDHCDGDNGNDTFVGDDGDGGGNGGDDGDGGDSTFVVDDGDGDGNGGDDGDGG